MMSEAFESVEKPLLNPSVTGSTMSNNYSNKSTLTSQDIKKIEETEDLSETCGLTMSELRRRLSILSKEQLLEIAAYSMYTSKELFAAGESILETDPASRRVMVRGLWFHTTDDTFREYFSQFGPLENSAVIRCANGKSQGYGFLIYKNRYSAQAVINKAHILDQREINAKLAADRYTVFEKDDNCHAKQTEKRKLFIRNISAGITRQMLEDMFNQYGEIENCAIVRPNKSSPRAYGFITFKCPKAALRAAQIPFRVLNNWVIFVSFSIGNEKRCKQIQNQVFRNNNLKTSSSNNKFYDTECPFYYNEKSDFQNMNRSLATVYNTSENELNTNKKKTYYDLYSLNNKNNSNFIPDNYEDINLYNCPKKSLNTKLPEHKIKDICQNVYNDMEQQNLFDESTTKYSKFQNFYDRPEDVKLLNLIEINQPSLTELSSDCHNIQKPSFSFPTSTEDYSWDVTHQYNYNNHNKNYWPEINFKHNGECEIFGPKLLDILTCDHENGPDQQQQQQQQLQIDKKQEQIINKSSPYMSLSFDEILNCNGVS